MSEESSSQDDVLKKESHFHDEWAKQTDLTEIEVRRAFEATTAPENQFILKKMGDLKGKKLLDIGCGLGESSVYFALQGAEVTSVDLSPEMVQLTENLALKFGVSVHGVASSMEYLALEPHSFDFVYLGNIIHHIQDREALYPKIDKLLKKGGAFFSWDPVAYNPLINIYRWKATKVRTEDEMPLKWKDLRIARKTFPKLQYQMFWILTLSLMIKYYLVDRVNPNQDRYWKRILKEDESKLGWFRILQGIDQVLTRIPGLRWWAWNVVLWGTKE